MVIVVRLRGMTDYNRRFKDSKGRTAETVRPICPVD